MFRKYNYHFLLILAVACLFGIAELAQPDRPWLQEPAPMPDSVINALLDQKSSIGTTEDPQARQRWLWLMLRDPATGQIPANIQQREIAFAHKLPLAKNWGPKARKAETNWQSAGPYNIAGRTRALAIDVRNEQILLAGGVSGGMWRSTNGGQNWAKTTNPQQLQSVTCLVQDVRPGNQNVWYYGSGELIGNSARGGEAPYRGDGIYKSIDNGLTWAPLPATSTNLPQKFDQPFDYIFNLKINAANASVQELYAAAYGGIYKSINGGLAWTNTLTDNAALYTDVEITQTGVVYASLSTIVSQGATNSKAGIYRSANGGTSWQKITPPNWPEEYGRVVIAANPQNPDEVYFLGYVPEDIAILWRYQHSAAGGTWTNLSANLPKSEDPVAGLDLQGGYNMVVKVHPLNTRTVFVGGTNLYRSTSGFTNTTATAWIGGYSPKNDVAVYANQHPDQHALVFYPSDPARAIAGHDGGLSRTANILADSKDEELKVKWEALNSGYVTTQFYTVGLDQSQVNDLILGGMQDNGSYLTPEASAPAPTWIRMLGGDGGFTHVASKGSYYYVSFQNSQIYRLTLNSQYKLTSFARIDPPGAGLVEGQLYLFVNPYVFDPTNKNRMYLAAGDVVYRNRNITQIPSGSQQPVSLNWERLDETDISSGSISAISISTQPADILYYGTSDGQLYKATSANSIPDVRRLTASIFPEEGYIAHIAINPANADEVVVVFSNYNVRSIFHSDNGGQSFTDISGNLEEFPSGEGSGPSVRYVEILPMTDGSSLYLAGTSTGVYSMRQPAGLDTKWLQEAPELIGRVVVPQIRHRSLDGRVVVATHGNGVYFKNYEGVQNTFVTPEGRPLSLLDPYPNPFTSREDLVIPFNLPRDGTVRIKVYDIKGQLIKLLHYTKEFAGTSEIVWDGRNVGGNPVPPAVYVIRMEFEDQMITRKVVLIR